MRHYGGTLSSLAFAFLAPKHHLHFLFSQQRVPTTLFLPDPETCLYQCFKPPATKGTAECQWEQRHRELSLVTPGVKQPVFHGGEGSAAGGWKTKHRP